MNRTDEGPARERQRARAGWAITVATGLLTVAALPPPGEAVEPAVTALRTGGHVQMDAYRFGDPSIPSGGFLVRRARARLDGTLHPRLEFRLVSDFGDGKIQLLDAWLDVRATPRLSLRIGRAKSPIGFERLQSATDRLFAEPALPTNLVPNRDVGVLLTGELAGALTCVAGITNGVPDGASGDRDDSSDPDAVGRLFIQPLRGLGVGIAGTYGRQKATAASPALPRYRTHGLQTFFSYMSDGTEAGGARADGPRHRLAPQACLWSGRVAALAEHVTSSQRVRRGTHVATVDVRAWQVAVAVRLGRGTSPRSFRAAVTEGWHLVGRLARQEIDRDAFPILADPGRSARRARCRGVGLNARVTPAVRVLLDAETTRFDGGAPAGDRTDETFVVVRAQFEF